MCWKCALSPDSRLWLGIDACFAACSVAVMRGTGVVVSVCDPMERGHVERLAPMVASSITEAGCDPTDLTDIAVTTGPGGFTGTRLGVAFARGLALSTGARAHGVTAFEGWAAEAEGDMLVAVDGRRSQIFVQRFQDGTALAPAVVVDQDSDLDTDWRGLPVFGNGAMLLEAKAGRGWLGPLQMHAHIDAVSVVRAAAAKLERGAPDRPAPFYMRGADAKPQAKVSLIP